MRARWGWKVAVLGGALGAAPVVAFGQEARVEIEEAAPVVSVQAGGGVHGFMDTQLNRNTRVGGGWEARATVMPASPIALELAYLGAVNPLAGRELNGANVWIAKNGGEALVRANLASIAGAREIQGFDIEPFVAAGVSWANLQLTGDDRNMPEVEAVFAQRENLFGIPAAVGVQALYDDRLSLEARLAYDYAFDNDLTVQDTADAAQSWRATADLGLAF